MAEVGRIVTVNALSDPLGLRGRLVAVDANQRTIDAEGMALRAHGRIVERSTQLDVGAGLTKRIGQRVHIHDRRPSHQFAGTGTRARNHTG